MAFWDSKGFHTILIVIIIIIMIIKKTVFFNYFSYVVAKPNHQPKNESHVSQRFLNCGTTVRCAGPSSHYYCDYNVNECRYPYAVLRINKVMCVFFLDCFFFLLLFSVLSRQYTRFNQTCYSTVQLWKRRYNRKFLFIFPPDFTTNHQQSPLKTNTISTHAHIHSFPFLQGNY